ncbi:MAG: hypothetical protein LBG43_05350, partial [Treponema sp.]|nr:hypothetical protein [Treponema sp.]
MKNGSTSMESVHYTGLFYTFVGVIQASDAVRRSPAATLAPPPPRPGRGRVGGGGGCVCVGT